MGKRILMRNPVEDDDYKNIITKAKKNVFMTQLLMRRIKDYEKKSGGLTLEEEELKELAIEFGALSIKMLNTLDLREQELGEAIDKDDVMLKDVLLMSESAKECARVLTKLSEKHEEIKHKIYFMRYLLSATMNFYPRYYEIEYSGYDVPMKVFIPLEKAYLAMEDGINNWAKNSWMGPKYRENAALQRREAYAYLKKAEDEFGKFLKSKRYQ